MKLISVVTPCYNEEENIEILVDQVRDVFSKLPQYSYEHLWIDNASTDQSLTILKKLASTDRKIKIIANARNFGHIRSPYYALLQSNGDAVISLTSDLQDPPELIPSFIKKWEDGFKIVVGVKTQSEESSVFFALRKFYYRLVRKMAEIDLIDNFTGFGLYDQEIIKILRGITDPYPYFRGLICEIGFPKAKIEYKQPLRKRGITKNNFYTLYDIAMLGFVNHSKVPLRLATIIGFCLGALSFLVAVIYFIYKLLYWYEFKLGLAPVVIGLFFFSSVQLIFIGILGEYIGAIYTQTKNRPVVIEKERINF